MEKDYIFPEIYIEDSSIKSNKYIIIENERITIGNTCKPLTGRTRCFAKVPYDNALDLILDLYGNRLKKSFIVKTRDGNLLYIRSNISPKIIEVKGWIVRILVYEGQKIRKHQKIAYVLTKKYETRTIKSPWDGIVTYIGYVFGEKPEHYVIVVVGEDDIKHLGKPR